MMTRTNTNTKVFSTAILALIALLPTIQAGCLDFISFKEYRTHTCFRGAFTCLGDIDDNCHIGENQFIIDVDSSKVQDNNNNNRNIVGIKLENEGPLQSMIESIWIEDDFQLLDAFYPPTPVNNHGHAKFKVVNNETTTFNIAHAHGVEFDQHFVISELDAGNKLRSRLSNDASDGVWNTGLSNDVKNKKHDSVTMNFHSECKASEIETAIEYGLLRIGVQASHFESKKLSKHKGYVSCWERLRVVYDNELITSSN